jgi:hypothetical protein
VPRPAGKTGRRPLRLWFLAFVGFGLTIGAWALAAPYDGSGDESWHTLRAYQVPIQLHALQVAMVRFQRGIPKNPHLGSYNPFVGSWHPQVGSVLPILSATPGLLLLGVLCWRHAAGGGRAAPGRAGRRDGSVVRSAGPIDLPRCLLTTRPS